MSRNKKYNDFLKNQLENLWPVFNSQKEEGKIFWLGQGTEVKNSIPYDDGSGYFNLRYREAACNWLICSVFDVRYNKKHYFDESGEKGDGYIISQDMNILTEHVMAYNYDEKITSEQEKIDFIGNKILLKLKKGGSFEEGRKYIKGKILVVNANTQSDIKVIDYGKILSSLKSPYLPKNIIFIHLNSDKICNQIWDVTIFSITLSNTIFETYEVDLDLEKKEWEVKLSQKTEQVRNF
jgi:hypothetical protein